ncbi:DUF6534 domain-containing protein [Pleurotus pulmonarius]
MSDILSSTPSLASPLIFGMEIGIPLFAIAIAQAVTYYRSYPNDPTHNKVFDRLAERMPWSLLASGFFAYPAVTLVQLAYGRRVWYLSRQNRHLCAFIVSASVIQCVSGMAMNTVLLTDTSVHSMHSMAGETLGGIQLATSLLCDVLITGSLVYFLRQGRSSGFSSTKNVIDTLVLYSINIGLVTRYQPTFTSPGKKLTELYI